jgi:hypothetical protein
MPGASRKTFSPSRLRPPRQQPDGAQQVNTAIRETHVSYCYPQKQHRVRLFLMPLSFRARIFCVLLAALPAIAQPPHPAPAQQDIVPGNFVDITAKAGVHFQGRASHTTKKYLVETMGSGVALFDYDNDGLLDIFFVNGAPLSDPTAKGTIPQKRRHI